LDTLDTLVLDTLVWDTLVWDMLVWDTPVWDTPVWDIWDTLDTDTVLDTVWLPLTCNFLSS
jgi:hypothetical protein